MISEAEKRSLKAQAHALKPVIILGSRGLTDAVGREIDQALDAHELIKIKIGRREDSAEILERVAADHHAELIQKIGHIATFYRLNPEKHARNGE